MPNGRRFSMLQPPFPEDAMRHLALAALLATLPLCGLRPDRPRRASALRLRRAAVRRFVGLRLRPGRGERRRHMGAPPQPRPDAALRLPPLARGGLRPDGGEPARDPPRRAARDRRQRDRGGDCRDRPRRRARGGGGARRRRPPRRPAPHRRLRGQVRAVRRARHALPQPDPARLQARLGRRAPEPEPRPPHGGGRRVHGAALVEHRAR